MPVGAGAAAIRATCRPSACSRWTCEGTTCGPRSRGTSELDLASLRGGVSTSCAAQAAEALAAAEGFRRPIQRRLQRYRRPALLRPGLRGAGAAARRRRHRGIGPTAVVDAFHDAHRALYGYDFRGKAGQQVEWVNLRVTGIGPIPRPQISEIGARTGGCAARRRAATGSLLRRGRWARRRRSTGAHDLPARRCRRRPGRDRGVRLDRADASRASRATVDASATCRHPVDAMTVSENAGAVDRPGPAWRSSRAAWPPSRRRWRRRSAGPRGRR